MSALVGDVFAECNELRKGKQTISTTEALAGKEVIGLYFSASWCGPCKRFTPMLRDVYNILKQSGKSFEIIFVSSDSEDENFEEYYDAMPWLAVPFDETDLREGDLPQRFGYAGIPHLVLLDGQTGREITRDGTEIIGQFGPAAFPYDENAINAALEVARQKLLSVVNDWSILGSEADAATFRRKEAVAVLVGNSDGPAQHIAPRLKEAYDAIGGSRMAVVYIPHGVSNASKEAQFQSTFPADWIKLQRPETILTALSQALGGPPRPSLAVFSGDGKILFNEDASMLVYQVSMYNYSDYTISLMKPSRFSYRLTLFLPMNSTYHTLPPHNAAQYIH